MNYGGDAADQIVRYSLEGTEVALKLTGEAAKKLCGVRGGSAPGSEKNAWQNQSDAAAAGEQAAAVF